MGVRARVSRGHDGPAPLERLAFCECRQALSFYQVRDLDAHQVENGWHHIDQLHRIGDPSRRGDQFRIPHHEYAMSQLLIERLAMRRPAVLPEFLAVIGNHYDEGVIQNAELLELPD